MKFRCKSCVLENKCVFFLIKKNDIMHYFEFFHPCLTDKLKTERSCKLCEINCEPIPW